MFSAAKRIIIVLQHYRCRVAGATRKTQTRWQDMARHGKTWQDAIAETSFEAGHRVTMRGAASPGIGKIIKDLQRSAKIKGLYGEV